MGSCIHLPESWQGAQLARPTSRFVAMSCKNQRVSITEAALPYPHALPAPPYCAIQGSQDGLKIPFVPIPLPQIQK